MYVSNSRLPHVLPPSAYWSLESSQSENKVLLTKGWHLVGTTVELSQSGDFLTCQLLGIPIQVRNFDGQLSALSNVCAHRHCLITRLTSGRSSKMKCQYHGWEYDKTGRTQQIPVAKDFAPLDRERTQLAEYRVSTCGKLVFVSLAGDGPLLVDFLGDFFAVCSERFGQGWEPFLNEDAEHECNWKVPVEGTLEAYHVPQVHPSTFGTFPQEAKTSHVLGSNHTTLSTRLPFGASSKLDGIFQWLEARFLRLMGRIPTADYRHHHCFPNVLFSFTDAVSLCQCLVPTGPESCRSIVRQFGYVGKSRGPRRWIARIWGRLAARITKRILAEDRALFKSVQQGLRNSTHEGMLGRCEERIHAFQVYVDREVKVFVPEVKTQEVFLCRPFCDDQGLES
ncbi:MAG: dioxygenase Rieske iron-sulfur component [Schlesneria sp.]|nr:dioxygenase Rieske iron-sulfur component [Schlesneria sp.]